MTNEIARALRRRLTPQEAHVWMHLRALRPQGLHVRRQVPIGRFIIDLACLRARLAIEIDGAQHGTTAGLRNDQIRDRAVEAWGFKILRFWNADVDRSLIAVIDTIVNEANARSRGNPILPPDRDGDGL